MAFQIDEQKMKEMKTVDIDKIPLKQIPFAEFPKVVYLHPKDKSLEHKSKVVKDADEQKEAFAAGYREKPHIAVVEEKVDDGFEADAPEFEGAEEEGSEAPEAPKRRGRKPNPVPPDAA